ncbi:MAG: hypothetical protein OXQ29_08450, partial [Rhodospirillaceae bacterium]|nr:hypothetical protein [Rhodospirillaceae bacterium]
EQDLILLGENVVPIDELLQQAFLRFGYPSVIVCDRWRDAELREALYNLGLDIEIVTRGQGWKDQAEDVRCFRRGLLTRQIKPARGLLLRSAMSEAVTHSDPAGNEKVAKRRERSRDDAAVAALMAGAYAERELSSAPGPAYDYIPIAS